MLDNLSSAIKLTGNAKQIKAFRNYLTTPSTALATLYTYYWIPNHNIFHFGSTADDFHAQQNPQTWVYENRVARSHKIPGLGLRIATAFHQFRTLNALNYFR